VDLNPIRAALAETPETSDFTGAKDRIDDLTKRRNSAMLSRQTHGWERSRRCKKSGWLSPIEIDELGDAAGPNAELNGRRASQKGFLSMSLTEYLELLDWTGRQIRKDKSGAIPSHLLPILSRLGLDSSSWCDLVTKFGRVFKRAAGTVEHLSEEATRRGIGWMHSPGNPLKAA